MAFAPIETSRHEGDPVALYYFRWGTDVNSYYAWTDAEHDIIAPGSIAGSDVIYIPKPIQRDSITASGTLDKATIKLRVPRTLPIANRFSIFPPSIVVSAVIRQGHLGEAGGDYPAVWVGRVVGFTFEGSDAVLALEPFSTSMRRTGLRRNYQLSCPHVLYDANTCRADKAFATVTVAITSATSNVITMPAAWFPFPVTKYYSGSVQWINIDNNPELRTILSIINGKDLYLDGPANDLAGGSNIDVSLGCNRRAGVLGDTDGDCFNLHKEDGSGGATPNLGNFGGQPWIPLKNPMGITSNPYY